MSATNAVEPHSESDDPLSLKRVLALARRSLPYLREVLRELLRVGGLLMFFAAIGIPLGWFLTDLFTNRLGLGQPLTPFQAKVMLLDPAEFVTVEKLSVHAREVLRDRVTWFGLFMTLIGTPWGIWLTIWWIRMQQRINQSLRNHMMRNTHAGSLRHHSESKVGDSVYRAYQDSAQVTNLMSMFVIPIPMLFGLVTSIISILAFEWWLPLIVLLGIAVIYAAGMRVTDRLRHRFRIMRERNSVLTSHIQESMAGIKVVKAFGAENAQQERFEAASRDAFGAAYRARVGFANVNVVVFTFAALLVIPLSAVLALKAAAGDKILAGALFGAIGYSQWSLAVYTSAMGRSTGVLNTSRNLLSMWMRAQDMAIGMDRAFKQVDVEADVSDAPDAIPFEPPRDSIVFDRVSFAYQPDRPVLRDVSLVARTGTVTGLIGPTGSGKSTLVSLVLRLFDPDAGSITVDGINLSKFQLESLRSRVGIALQENLLFGTTIRENIRYAVPDATDEQVREAARIACADEFIERLPDAYDTELGERGAKLSSGQRQRLSIARAVIKDTPVLILDEPTASLDAATELRVLQNLDEWGQGRVILLITHRLSTIRRADQIVYLADGCVLEAGTHDSLMALSDGAYRQFVELELQSRIEPSGIDESAGEAT
jgi:ATP-binding cassette subfamily B protein